jgi:CheY-like chemotaxis protein
LTNLSNHTLLVVEDNEDDILFLERAFEEASLRNPLQILRDGDSAVEYLSGIGEYADRDRYPLPPLVLLDIRLPRRSGLEVLSWIKQQSGLRRLPVVILTTSRENSDINRAYDLGANSYLLKPVEPDDLREMVKTLNFYWLILNQHPDVEDR